MGAQHGFLGHCQGQSQWASEDLRQEPPKGGRTLGQGQGLLLDVATHDQWFWGHKGASYLCSFSLSTHSAHNCLFRATHMRTTVSAHLTFSQTHTSSTSNTYLLSRHTCHFENTCRHKPTCANSTTRWLENRNDTISIHTHLLKQAHIHKATYHTRSLPNTGT